MKKSVTLHTKVFITVFSALLGLLIIAAIVLWTVLDAYEATRPKNTAAQIFNRYFATYDFAGFLKAVEPNFASPESDDGINSAVKSHYNGMSLELLKLDSKTLGEEIYAVAADNKKIASFTLKKGAKSAKYGFKYYELSGGEVFFPERQNITVTVPAGYVLKFDSITVDSKYIVEKGIKDRSCDHVLAPAVGIYYEKYTVENLFSKPAVSVYSPDGTEVTTEYDISSGAFKASVKYDDILASEHRTYCLEAARAYAKYMTNDCTMQELSVYIDKSQPIYKKIAGVDLNWVPAHTGHSISGESASEFYRYSEDVFSCRVTLTATLSRPDYGDHNENIDVTFYFRKLNGRFLIYDIVTN